MTTKVQAEFLAAGIISDQTQVSAASADHLLIFDATDNSLKKALVSTIASGATALDDIGTGDAASTLATSSGDIILDSPDSIVLDADGDGSVSFKDGGTRYALIEKSSDSMIIRSDLSDGDIIFQGKDNTTTITALTLDMSEAGKATFNSDVALGDNKKLLLGAGDDLQIYHDGSNSYIADAGTGGLVLRGTDTVDIQSALGHNYLKSTISAGTQIYHNNSEKFATVSGGIKVTGNIENASGDMTIDVAGDLILDADGTSIKFQDGGTLNSRLGLDSAGLIVTVEGADKDFFINGDDGGSAITAIRVDMSEAGALICNGNITAFSDERLKDNIETLTDGLDKVEQLRGVTYTRDDREEIGVIAQEVEKILPEIVLTADDEMGTKSVDYSRLTAVLIEAVKDLSVRVKELEGK